MSFSLIAVFLFILLVALVIYSGLNDVMKVKKIFSQLAHQREGVLKNASSMSSIPGKGQGKSGQVVTFPHEDTNFYCYQEITGATSYGVSAHMCVAYNLEPPTNSSAKVFKKNILRAKSLESNNYIHKTNDISFDKEFQVESNDATLISELLTADIRHELMSIMKIDPEIIIKQNSFKAFYPLRGSITLDRYNMFIDFTLKCHAKLRKLKYV